jgi:hypothetical protein
MAASAHGIANKSFSGNLVARTKMHKSISFPPGLRLIDRGWKNEAKQQLNPVTSH